MIKFEDILAFVEENPDHVLATSWGQMLEDSVEEHDFAGPIHDPDYYPVGAWLDEAEEFTTIIMSDKEWDIYLAWRMEKGGWPEGEEW